MLKHVASLQAVRPPASPSPLRRMRRFAWLVIAAVGIGNLGAAPALTAESPFDPGLDRLAEVLGSLHFLSTLCGKGGDGWREEMETLLATENPDEKRRARFVAGFNRGYQSFAGTYKTCTPSATAAVDLYVREGETLTRSLTDRFGN